MVSFAQHISKNSNDTLYLVHGGCDRTGQPAWYFIRVDNVKTQGFLRAIKMGAINLGLFGEIMESGYGEKPPQALISHMKANYGFTG